MRRKQRTIGQFRSFIDALEPRLLLSGAGNFDCQAADGSAVPAGIPPAIMEPVSVGSSTLPLSSLPALHSDPVAPATLYLNFAGAPP